MKHSRGCVLLACRKAEPVEKLTVAYQKFLSRSMRQLKATEEDVIENHASARSFGTILTKQTRNQVPERSDIFRKKQNPDRAPGNINFKRVSR